MRGVVLCICGVVLCGAVAQAKGPTQLTVSVRGELPAGWVVHKKNAKLTVLASAKGGVRVFVTEPGLITPEARAELDDPAMVNVFETAASAARQYSKRVLGAAAAKTANVGFGYTTVAGKRCPAGFVTTRRPDGSTLFVTSAMYRDARQYSFLLLEVGALRHDARADAHAIVGLTQAYDILATLKIGKP